MLDKLYWKDGLPSRVAETNLAACAGDQTVADRLRSALGVPAHLATQLTEWEPLIGARRVALLLELARRQAEPDNTACLPDGWIPSPTLVPSDSRETRRLDLTLLRICGLIEQGRARWGRSTCTVLRLADPLPTPDPAILEYLAFHADGPLASLRRVIGRMLVSPPANISPAAMAALQRLRLAYRVTLDTAGNPIITAGAPQTPPAMLRAIARRAIAPIPMIAERPAAAIPPQPPVLRSLAHTTPGAHPLSQSPGSGNDRQPEPAPNATPAEEAAKIAVPLYPVIEARPGAPDPDPLTLKAWLPVITPRGMDLLLRLCALELRDHPTRAGMLPPVRALARAGLPWMPARSTLQRFLDLWAAIGLVRREVTPDGQIAFVVARERILPSIATLEYLAFDAPAWIRRHMARLLRTTNPQALGMLAPLIAHMRASGALVCDPLPRPLNGRRLTPGYHPLARPIFTPCATPTSPDTAYVAAPVREHTPWPPAPLCGQTANDAGIAPARAAHLPLPAEAPAGKASLAASRDLPKTVEQPQPLQRSQPVEKVFTANEHQKAERTYRELPDETASGYLEVLLTDLATGLTELGALIPALADPQAVAVLARFTTRIGADLARLAASDRNHTSGPPPQQEHAPAGHSPQPREQDASQACSPPRPSRGTNSHRASRIPPLPDSRQEETTVARNIGGGPSGQPDRHLPVASSSGSAPSSQFDTGPTVARYLGSARPAQTDLVHISLPISAAAAAITASSPGQPENEASIGPAFANEIARTLFHLFYNEEDANDFDTKLDIAACMVAQAIGDPHWRSFREPLRPLLAAGRWRAIDAAFSVVHASTGRGVVKNRAALLIATLKRYQGELPGMPRDQATSATGNRDGSAAGTSALTPENRTAAATGADRAGSQRHEQTPIRKGSGSNGLPATLDEAFELAIARARGRSVQELLDEYFHDR